MQNVAWAMTREWKPKPMRKLTSQRSIRREKLFCNATAVTMPGRAMGSTIRNDSVCLPKNW